MDILNLDYRKAIIDDINSDENVRRKDEHQKRQHVFNDHARPYVLKMLTQEFTAETVAEMRTCTSVNLSRRIITEMASIYKKCPERAFTGMTDIQIEGIEYLYESMRADVKLKKANQKYKLHDQCAIQVLPNEGTLTMKLLAPHQFDVIPLDGNPEKAYAYIISTLDKTILDSGVSNQTDIQGSYYGSPNEVAQPSTNKKIADQGDYKETLNRFVIWTAEHNLICDGSGQILEAFPNPIGMLPFIDVASEKDFEYWVRRGSGVIDFALDFSVVLSDTCNTNRLQSYAQAVITAEKIPQSITVGPQHVLFLPIDPARPEIVPTFQFATPQPDMAASLNLQDRLVSYFLSAHGVDPKTINSSGTSQTYNSGLERLLASLERFEASQDDIDLFSCVEEELFTLVGAWYNAIRGTDMLYPEYDFGAFPDAELTVNFSAPSMVQTAHDTEDSVIRRLDSGLMSKVEAIMELRNVDEPTATDLLKKINAADVLNAPDVATGSIRL